MTLFQLTVRMVEALEAEAIPYLVTGAIAVGVQGLPRGTKDLRAPVRAFTAISSGCAR